MPVFHRQGDRRGRFEEGRGWVDYTACGREVSPYKPWLPTRHVVKFARPCRGCFPQ